MIYLYRYNILENTRIIAANEFVNNSQICEQILKSFPDIFQTQPVPSLAQNSRLFVLSTFKHDSATLCTL